ncbi:MAG: M28 family peptidase [Saprospiraceae bacterium]|nr:M28 family peptidase [Saprospiraceae bacterium]
MSKKTSRSRLAYILIAALLISTIFVTIQPFLPALEKNTPQPPPPPPPVEQVAVPTFNVDSAYLFLQKQVDFGPRVPNTAAHQKCAAWFSKEFKRHGLTVIEQPFKAIHYKGTTFNAVNIIAQYKPELPKRILLAAHWDSRFQADKDEKNQSKPIDGADDGASGVAVLLEIARTLATNPVNVGVDLVLFDVEDQGDDNGASETWCLGSQYWASNLHKPGYMPYTAVLLDMVGAKDAKFMKEGISMQVAPETVDKIWSLASTLGYGSYFDPSLRSGITDDHVFVAQGARIPMVDIISTPNEGEDPFGRHHHRHSDNMSVIDKNSLKAVGQTMTTYVYQTYNGVL